MRLGYVIDKASNGAEIRKFHSRTGVRYFAWPLGATVATSCVTLREARAALNIDNAPKKIAA